MRNPIDITQIRVEIRVGSGYAEGLTAAHELACRFGCEVLFNFNDKEYLVHYNSNIPDMVADFYKSLIPA